MYGDVKCNYFEKQNRKKSDKINTHNVKWNS